MAKVEQIELDKIKEFQKNIDQNVYTLGQLDVEVHNLNEQLKIVEKQKSDIRTTLLGLTNAQNDYFKILETKYGQGVVNLDTGEISQ